MEAQKNDNVKLYGVTLTYNEEKTIPYVMAYHERLGFDKLIVYDNESTDRTVELLKQYPFVEVRTFHTEGMNDLVHSKIKSEAFEEFCNENNAWMYIGDFDEVLYYNGNFKEYLKEKDAEGYTCFNRALVEPLTYNFPDKNKLVHEQTDNCVFFGGAPFKMTLVKVSGMKGCRFSPGAHQVNIISSIGKKSLNKLKEIYPFHLKFIDHDHVLQKTKTNAARFSEENKKHGFGMHYYEQSKQEVFDKMWDDKINSSFSHTDYINGNIKEPEGGELFINWRVS